MPAPIQIDGSVGEGGGQIIRTSLSLAAVTGAAVEIVNVRARRARPGLQPQHLAAVRAAAQLCSAALEGDEVGSKRILFRPAHQPYARTYRFDIGTAGASPLVIQTVAAPLITAGGAAAVTVTGGTHVPHAPPAEYLESVYFPALERAGVAVGVRETAAGFYPRGGGQLTMEIPSSAGFQPINLTDRGKLVALKAYVVTSQLPDHVAQRGQAAIEKSMRAIGRSAEIEIRDLPSNGPGAAVVLAARCENGFAGFTGIGERGKPMETVAEEACAPFITWWNTGACCDEHLSDQLVLPMALTQGTSRWTTPCETEHLRTVLQIASRFVPMTYRITPAATGSIEVELSLQ